jgi:diacylglycerol kinase family enzyme
VYVYVYDETLEDRRHEREREALDTRLTDLEITGKVLRLAQVRDAIQAMRKEIREGATTLVAVGTEHTLRRAIEAVGDSRVVVAFLPVGEQSKLAELLGIPTGIAACDILSHRLVEEMDLGEVNGRRFLHVATMDFTGCVMQCDQLYTLTPLRRGQLEIRNLAWPDDIAITNPADEKLSFVIRLPRLSLFKKKADVSVVPLRRARIFCPSPRVMDVDGEKVEAQEFDIRTIPQRLRLVVSKDRKYAEALS